MLVLVLDFLAGGSSSSASLGTFFLVLFLNLLCLVDCLILSENVAAFSENVDSLDWLRLLELLLLSENVAAFSENVDSLDWLRLLEFLLLSENVAAFSENVDWLGPPG